MNIKKQNYILNLRNSNKCWNCESFLDFEEKFFNNQCPYCFSSQGFDLEDFGGFYD